MPAGCYALKENDVAFLEPLQLTQGRMLACARSKLWWMTPEWRRSTRTLPPETQFLIVRMAVHFKQGLLLACACFELSPNMHDNTCVLMHMPLQLELAQGGPYALLLPLIDGEFRATLRQARCVSNLLN